MSLTLTKISETNSTITLGWTPPANVGGYVLYANGQVVSVATANLKNGQPRNRVEYSKTSPGPPFEVVAVVHPPAVDWDAYPDSPPPPTSDQALRDKPPGYPDYAGFQRVTLGDRSYLEMFEDTLLTIGHIQRPEGIALVAHKRCVVVDHWSITVTGSSRAAGVGLALTNKTDAAHIHIERGRIKPTMVNGVWQRTITDCFASRSQRGKVTLQKILAGPISIKTGYTAQQIHPDIFQFQEAADNLHVRVHRLTGYTDYTGIMESEFRVGSQDWSHVNIVATGYSAHDLDPEEIDPAADSHTVFGMYGAGATANLPNLKFTEFYYARDPEQPWQTGYTPIELVTQKGGKYGKPRNALGSEYDFVTDADLLLPTVYA